MIADQLAAADCVIVTWTAASLGSDWVQDEAEEGRQRGVLIPVVFEPVRPPAGFRQVQAADLSQWAGSAQHPEFRSLVFAIRSLVQIARATGQFAAASPPGAVAEAAAEPAAACAKANAPAGVAPSGDDATGPSPDACRPCDGEAVRDGGAPPNAGASARRGDAGRRQKPRHGGRHRRARRVDVRLAVVDRHGRRHYRVRATIDAIEHDQALWPFLVSGAPLAAGAVAMARPALGGSPARAIGVRCGAPAPACSAGPRDPGAVGPP